MSKLTDILLGMCGLVAALCVVIIGLALACWPFALLYLLWLILERM